jgi:uncharacterized protein involved in response to NO
MVTKRGEVMLELRKRRMAASPPLLRGGFRPFFLGAAAWAVLALPLWLMALAGTIALPSTLDALSWHRHEMLFGFVGAAITGFVLTAIPNWTGRLPIAGLPLAGLAGLWLIARLAVLFSSRTAWSIAAAIDVAFWIALASLAAREVLLAKNRNLPIVVLILLFGIANGLDHLAAGGLLEDRDAGVRAGISLAIVMISLIGGRIVPSFTRNWLAKRGMQDRLPTQPSRFDMAVIAATAVALVAWLAAPGAAGTGYTLIVAAALQFTRLARWRGLRTAREPLLFVLHLGYSWVPLGLLLLGASILESSAIPRAAAIHALTAGAMGTMILAVMTRATLGHTGRELKANGATIAAYGSVTIGAVLRVAAPLAIVDYAAGMQASALAWSGAFLIFLIAYGPILAKPRIGESR